MIVLQPFSPVKPRRQTAAATGFLFFLKFWEALYCIAATGSGQLLAFTPPRVTSKLVASLLGVASRVLGL